MDLADRKCIPCQAGTPPIQLAQAHEMLKELSTGWGLDQAGHLERTYVFKNFALALEFANKVGAIAEVEGHHPDLHVAWGKCRVEIWTHTIKGLTENDFTLAAKADRAYESMSDVVAR